MNLFCVPKATSNSTTTTATIAAVALDPDELSGFGDASGDGATGHAEKHVRNKQDLIERLIKNRNNRFESNDASNVAVRTMNGSCKNAPLTDEAYEPSAQAYTVALTGVTVYEVSTGAMACSDCSSKGKRSRYKNKHVNSNQRNECLPFFKYW